MFYKEGIFIMRKKLTILMATVLSGAMLTGCTGSGNSTSGASDSASTSASIADSIDSDSLTGSLDDSATAASTQVEELSEDGYLDYYVASDYVTLGEYKGVEVEVPKIDITDDDVQTTLLSSYSSYFTVTEVTDRTDVQMGDTVNIDYVGKYADTLEEFSGGTGSGYDLVIGSGTFIPGFEDGLIGAELGSTVDINLTFPEDYSASDLAGVDVIFTVTINSISAPTYSEEEIEAIGIDGVTDMESLLNSIRTDLEEEAQEENDDTVKSDALEIVHDNATFAEQFPQVLIDRFIADYEDTLEYYMQMYSYYYGVSYDSVDDYIAQIYGIETDEVAAYKEEQAVTQLEYIFLERAIADEEGITVTDEDIENELLDVATQSGYTDVDSFAEYYNETYGRDVRKLAKEQLIAEKTLDFIAENATVVEVIELEAE